LALFDRLTFTGGLLSLDPWLHSESWAGIGERVPVFSGIVPGAHNKKYI
jgi:hypothetical protein